MAGRAEHFRLRNKHAQRPVLDDSTKPKPVDDLAALPSYLEAVRNSVNPEGTVLPYFFAVEMDVPHDEASRRLRYLSKMGVLKMGVEREDERFVRYFWTVVDMESLQKTDLA